LMCSWEGVPSDRGESGGRRRKPCIVCKGPKGPGKGRLWCDRCQEDEDRRVSMCVTCGIAPSMPGHRKVCAECADELARPALCVSCKQRPRQAGKRKICEVCEHTDRMLAPCRKCGGERAPGSRAHYCPDCRELIDWAARKRQQARSKTSWLPCRGCNGRRDHRRDNPCSPYCSNCKPLRTPKPLCSRCGKPKGQGSGRRLCPECEPYARGRRRPCARCKKPKPPGRGVRYCGSCEPTPEQRRERRAVNARIKRRARRLETDGVTTLISMPVRLGAYRPLLRNGTGHKEGADLMLDAAPLRAWLEAVERRTTRSDLAALSGIGERRIYELVKGRKKDVSLGVAATLLEAAGTVEVEGFGCVDDVADLWPSVDEQVAAIAA
jgi:hypothetical protein